MINASPNHDVLLLGLSGLGAQTSRDIFPQPWFAGRLAAIATASHESETGSAHDIADNSARESLEVPVLTIEEALDQEWALVVSNLRRDAAEQYEEAFKERGSLVFTTAEPNRVSPNTALINPYVNIPDLQSSLKRRDSLGKIIATEGAVSNLVTIVLNPVARELGIKGLEIETLQGQKGMGSYISDKPNSDPIAETKNDDDSQIKSEVQTILGPLAPKHIRTKPNYAGWESGHHVRMDLEFEKGVSEPELQKILASARTPNFFRGLHVAKGLKIPKKPVRVINRELLDDDPDVLFVPAFQPIFGKVLTHVKSVTGKNNERAEIEIFGDNSWPFMQNIINLQYAIQNGLV